MNIGRFLGAAAVVVAAVVLATVPASHSQAQHRRTVVVNGGTCATPTFSGVVAPVTTYGGTYSAGHVVKEYVPVAIPTAYPAVAVPVYSYVNAPSYVPGAVYGSVMQGPGGSSDEKVADLVVEKLKKQGLVGPGVQPVAPVPPGEDTGGPPAVKTGVAPKVGAVDTKDFAAKAEALLTAKCATCHGGQAKAGGGYAFFDDTKKLIKMGAEDRIEIYDSIYEGRMPKNGTPFTDQEVEWVRVWMRQR